MPGPGSSNSLIHKKMGDQPGYPNSPRVNSCANKNDLGYPRPAPSSGSTDKQALYHVNLLRGAKADRGRGSPAHPPHVLASHYRTCCTCTDEPRPPGSPACLGEHRDTCAVRLRAAARRRIDRAKPRASLRVVKWRVVTKKGHQPRREIRLQVDFGVVGLVGKLARPRSGGFAPTLAPTQDDSTRCGSRAGAVYVHMA